MAGVSEWLSGLAKSIDPVTSYVSFCLSQPMQAPVCRQFWTWIMIAAFGAAVLGVAWFAWRFVAYRLKLAAARRAQEERERVADEQTLAQLRWTGDDHAAADVAGEDIETRIRAFLKERRDGGVSAAKE